MKDGSEYVSEELEYSVLFNFTDYVFNSSQGKFINRRIWSRFPTSLDVFAMSILAVIVSIAVLGLKSIVGAIVKVKPTSKRTVSILLSNLIGSCAILLCYVFIPINIHLLIIGVIIGTAFFEHKYLKAKCPETTQTRRIIYIAVANAMVIAGVVCIIIFMFYGVFI